MSVALEKSLVENLVPMNDRILVQRDEEEEISIGGIVIPDTAKEKPVRGTVVAVGQGKRLKSGQIQALTLKKGNKIYFGKYSGSEIKFNGKELVVMREDDVLLVIEN